MQRYETHGQSFHLGKLSHLFPVAADVQDIIALVPALASDKNGRRAILYLLTPTSTRHFIPSTLSTLSASAQKARDIGTSKKDPAIRRKELVSYASPGLLEVMAEKGAELVRDPGAGLLVQEVMLYAEGGGFLCISGAELH